MIRKLEISYQFFKDVWLFEFDSISDKCIIDKEHYQKSIEEIGIGEDDIVDILKIEQDDGTR